MEEGRQRSFNLWGWALFGVSAIFYILAALRQGDPLALVGSLFFLVACVVFALPLLARRIPSTGGSIQDKPRQDAVDVRTDA